VNFLLLLYTLIAALVMLPFLTLQNIRLCIESSLDEYIMLAKNLQGNTHDMIIEKLTSSYRAYVSAKEKQQIRIQKT